MTDEGGVVVTGCFTILTAAHFAPFIASQATIRTIAVPPNAPKSEGLKPDMTWASEKRKQTRIKTKTPMKILSRHLVMPHHYRKRGIMR